MEEHVQRKQKYVHEKKRTHTHTKVVSTRKLVERNFPDNGGRTRARLGTTIRNTVHSAVFCLIETACLVNFSSLHLVTRLRLDG
jgi:hypothetical protein